MVLYSNSAALISSVPKISASRTPNRERVTTCYGSTYNAFTRHKKDHTKTLKPHSYLISHIVDHISASDGDIVCVRNIESLSTTMQ